MLSQWAGAAAGRPGRATRRWRLGSGFCGCARGCIHRRRASGVCDVHASEVHMGISRRGPGPSVWTLALTGIADSDDADSGDIGRDLGEIIDCVQRLLQKFRNLNEQVHWHATARQLELQV